MTIRKRKDLKPEEASGCCPTCRQPLPPHPGLLIDSKNSVVIYHGAVVLPLMENSVMRVLWRAYPNTVNHEHMAYAIWGQDGVDRKTIHTSVKRLRRKIEKIGLDVVVHVGLGYQLVIPYEGEVGRGLSSAVEQLSSKQSVEGSTPSVRSICPEAVAKWDRAGLQNQHEGVRSSPVSPGHIA